MLYDYLYTLYGISSNMDDSGYALNQAGYKVMLFLIIGRQILFFLAFFILRGIALYKMAENRGIKNAYFAFIPFLSYTLMGKLQANGKYVSGTKNFYIVAMVCCAVYLALALVTDICFAVKPLKALFSEGRPLNADDFARNSFLLNAIDTIGYLVMTAYAIFSLFTYSNLFRAYAPEKVMKYNLFSLLGYVLLGSFFVPALILFINRNAAYVDYDDYVNGMRRKYYTASYANEKPQSHKGNKQADDPFAEFSSDNIEDDPFKDFDNGKK